MEGIKIHVGGNSEECNVSRKVILREFSLHNRDLRPIFLTNQVATLLVRKDSLVVNFLRLRLVIGKDVAYVFNTANKDSFTKFVDSVASRLRADHEMPFEFVVLETALEHVCQVLEGKFAYIQETTQILLEKLQTAATEDNFEKLLMVKKKVSNIETHATEIHAALLETLEDDEDLSDMYLSDFPRQDGEPDTEEIESILDNYLEIIEDISHQIAELKSNIDSTQEIITLKLSSLRNTIIKVDLFISFITAIMAIGALIVGAFGMNLTSHFETNPYSFYIVLGSIAVFSLLFLLSSYRYFRKQKIL